jgi:hypothetical protein
MVVQYLQGLFYNKQVYLSFIHTFNLQSIHIAFTLKYHVTLCIYQLLEEILVPDVNKHIKTSD